MNPNSHAVPALLPAGFGGRWLRGLKEHPARSTDHDVNAKTLELPARLARRWRNTGDRLPVRAIVALFALLGIALGWVVLFQQIEHQESAAIASAQVSNINLAQAFNEHVLRIVRDVDLQSRLLAAEVQRGGIGRVDLRAFHRTISAAMPFVLRIGLIDAAGYLVSSSEPVDRLFMGDREHFLALKGADSGSLFIGRPVTSRSTGVWWIPMTRRLNAANGEFAGVLILAVDPEYFSRFYGTVSLGRDGVVTLYRNDGIVLARQPDLIQSIGRDASALPDAKVMLTQGAGFRVTKGAFDGIRRVIAFSSLADYPLKVVVGTSLDEALAPVRGRKPTFYFVAAVITAFILATSFAIAQLYHERKLSVAALRESEARFRDLTNLSSDWFWEQDAELRFTSVSRGLYVASGVNPAATIGKRRWELPDASPQDEQWRAHRAQVERHEPFIDFAYRTVNEAGDERWLSISGKPLFGADGRFLGYRGTGRDITARKQSEEALQRSGREILRLNEGLEHRVAERTAELETAVKEMETFTHTVAHDLRSPLRAINGYASILIEHLGNTACAEDRACLERVAGNAKRMGRLIDDLLDFSRYSHQPIRKRDMDVQALARSVLAERVPADGTVQAKLGDLPPCKADPSLLRIVIENLVSNAVKFSRNATPPIVEIGHADGAYYVRDNGVGFDMSHADKLFGPFTRMHRAEEYEGTGMGLAIVSRIVERHGGRVWAQAEPGKGATFFLTLG